MREVSFNRFGYSPRGWHGRGMFFLPIVPLLLGLFVLFLVIKSGLWLPLLVLGLVFWMFSPIRRWRTHHYYGESTPKKNDHIEYV